MYFANGFKRVGHRYANALSAYVSGLEEATIVMIDGRGIHAINDGFYPGF
jgi:predicted NodU family carbamoyl transferase